METAAHALEPRVCLSASILHDVKDRHAADWEDLARREPYFPVLTDDGFLGVESNRIATAAFFDTGEADISSLLAAINSLLGREISLTSALDFGCGVGRLTLPLARRAVRVVACDIAPTMLVHARQNAEGAGLRNGTFIESSELAGLPRGCFDFVCSLLVFQYIHPALGYELIRTLLSLLAPGGVAALHVTFEKPGGALRRLARLIRRRPRFTDRRIGVARRENLRPPYVQMSEYDKRVVLRDIEAAGARVAGRFTTHHGGTTGAVLIIQRPPGPPGAAGHRVRGKS